MNPLSPIAWYGILVLRYTLAAGLGWVSVQVVWARDWAFWVKVVAEFLLVNGLIVGALVTGPVTYRGIS
jgi:hypothetical protein